MANMYQVADKGYSIACASLHEALELMRDWMPNAYQNEGVEIDWNALPAIAGETVEELNDSAREYCNALAEQLGYSAFNGPVGASWPSSAASEAGISLAVREDS